MNSRSPVIPIPAAVFSAALGAWLFTIAAAAAPAHSVRATRVIKDVKLQSGRAVTLDAPLPDGSAIRTGVNSRAEIASSAGAITRLGAKTVCAFNPSQRTVQLQEGAVLFQVPKGAGRSTLKTGVVSVDTTGTTGILERHQNAYVKLLVLQGTARAYLNRIGESVLVQPGQMLITKPEAKVLPEAVHFDVDQLYRTSVLTNSDFAPLASRGEIAREIQKQRNDPDFVRTNLVIYGRGTLVNLVEPTPQTSTTHSRASPTPAPESRARAPSNL